MFKLYILSWVESGAKGLVNAASEMGKHVHEEKCQELRGKDLVSINPGL